MITELKSKKTFFPLKTVRNYARQILTGLKEIHSREVVHRDLKPENVLVSEDDEIKICDFGSSKILDPEGKNTPYIVSRYYRAPELILGVSRYSEKIDIWATGCIIAELLTLKPLFPGKTEGSQLLEQIAILGTPSKSQYEKMTTNIPKTTMKMLNQLETFERKDLTEIFSKYYKKREIKHAVSLIESMLEWNPNDRTTAEEALQHPFLQDVYDEEEE